MNKFHAYLRKDGRFECRITIALDGTGKKKSRSFYGKTKEEAEFKAMSASGSATMEYAETEMTVGQLAEDYFTVMKSNVKASTLANYRMKAEKHILPKFRDMQCCKLNVSEIHTLTP